MGGFRGDFKASVGGESLTFAADYAAQDLLRDEFGADWRGVLGIAMVEHDAAKLGMAAHICLRRHHPEISHQVMRDWSPPLGQLVPALSGCLRLAFWGPEGPPADAPGKPGQRNGASLSTLWRRMWLWRNAWASPPANSGGSAPLN